MKIKIEKINIDEFAANTNGPLAIERANEINANINSFASKLDGKTIEVSGRPYAGSFCIGDMGIYAISSKGAIPERCVAVVDFDGELMFEISYRQPVDYNIVG